VPPGMRACVVFVICCSTLMAQTFVTSYPLG
jgi:hypothetical protein